MLESLNLAAKLVSGAELTSRLGSCSQPPGGRAAGCESSQFCPFGRLSCSIPAWIPSHAGCGDVLSLAEVPILSILEGIANGFASIWLAAFPAHCLHGRGNLCTLHSHLPCVPHTAGWGSRGRVVLFQSLWFLHLLCYIWLVFFLLQLCLACSEEGSSRWNSQGVVVCRLTNVGH